MKFAYFPVLYTVFDGELLFPSEINISRNSMVVNDIGTNVTDLGLILPYRNTIPNGNITLEYLGSKEYTWGEGRLFLALGPDGHFTEYFCDPNQTELVKGKISNTFTRQTFSDDSILNVISPIMLKSENIDQYANLLEKILGFDVTLWKVYNLKQLHQYVLGNIPLDKVKPRSIKSEFKTIWLK